ncbi:MAG: hypothetical protein ACLUQ6_01965 [Alistipes onderdonkii]
MQCISTSGSRPATCGSGNVFPITTSTRTPSTTPTCWCGRRLYAPSGGIADFEAYFRACYRHAVLHRRTAPAARCPSRHGFLSAALCDEGPTVPEEELGACERLVLDILAFIRRSFPHEVCRLFLLRYYESPRPCSYRLLAQYAGTTPSRAAREVKAVVQAVRANRRFARRSHRPAAAESPYAG